MTSEMVCRKVWNTAGRGYSPLLSTNRVHQYVTCRELPLGKCIMMSEMVCRKVWNTAGRGYSPLLSTNRVHQYVTCRELPLGKCIMTSEMVCRKVWNTAGRGFTASPAIVMSDSGCSHIHDNSSFYKTNTHFLVAPCRSKELMVSRCDIYDRLSVFHFFFVFCTQFFFHLLFFLFFSDISGCLMLI